MVVILKPPFYLISTWPDFIYRSKIIITSRSPLKGYWQDPRIEFIALDFLEPVETIVSRIAPYCHDVTHAYYASYVHTDDFARLKVLNVPLFENFLTAIDQVARNTLQRVCLQTGGKVSFALLYAHWYLLRKPSTMERIWAR